MPDSVLPTVLLELHSVFTAIVHSDHLQVPSSFSVGSHLEHLEDTQYLILRLLHVSPQLMPIIIYEVYEVLSTRMRPCIYIAHIGVYKFQGIFPLHQRPRSKGGWISFVGQAVDTFVQMHILHFRQELFSDQHLHTLLTHVR